ncbi:acyl carrier protein [Paenibacillus chitinolyticus]
MSAKESAKDQIRLFLSDQGCGMLPVEEISEEKRLFDVGFDSLRFMELVVLIEEHFRIQWPDEALEISGSTQVGDIVQALEGCL